MQGLVQIREVLAGKRRFAVVCSKSEPVLEAMPFGSVHALILDPPSGTKVFGKIWDSSHGGRRQWIEATTSTLQAHKRVLIPGGLCFVWSYPKTSHWTGTAIEDAGFEIVDCFYHLFSHRKVSSPRLPKTSCEMWWLCRRPGSFPVQPGVDACRIPVATAQPADSKASAGRHPSTVILSHTEASSEPCGPGCVIHDLDQMSGQLKSGTGARVGKSKAGYQGNAYGKHCRPEGTACVCYGDQGGASRFFSVLHNDPPFLYCNRASKAERNAGLPEGMQNEGVAVKPNALMRRLVKLANVPPSGIVLDGYAGTGSTGCACMQEGVRFIGIEQNKADADVARYRISHHQELP